MPLHACPFRLPAPARTVRVVRVVRRSGNMPPVRQVAPPEDSARSPVGLPGPLKETPLDTISQ